MAIITCFTCRLIKCQCGNKELNVETLDQIDTLETIQLKCGKYSLTRTRDGAGDSGIMLSSLQEPEGATTHNQLIPEGESGLLKKGNWVEVGSLSSRSFFRCTPITRFIEMDKDDNGEVTRVLFKTLNSEYEVRVF